MKVFNIELTDWQYKIIGKFEYCTRRDLDKKVAVQIYNYISEHGWKVGFHNDLYFVNMGSSSIEEIFDEKFPDPIKGSFKEVADKVDNFLIKLDRMKAFL